MALGDLRQRIQRSRHQHHERDPRLLGRRPQPVRRAVREPRALQIGVEGEAHAEHARLLLPVRHERAALRLLECDPAHDREAVGIEARRFQRELVAVALPRGRHDHDPADAGQIHLEEQRFLGDGIRFLSLGRAARRPRTVWRVSRPEVHLRVDDMRAMTPSARSGPANVGQVRLAPQLEREQAPQRLAVILVCGDVLGHQPRHAVGIEQADGA